MITAATITDEQIRELRESTELDLVNEKRWWRGFQHLSSESGERQHHRRMLAMSETRAICDSALNPQCHKARRDEARARCAKILNARTAGATKAVAS